LRKISAPRDTIAFHALLAEVQRDPQFVEGLARQIEDSSLPRLNAVLADPTASVGPVIRRLSEDLADLARLQTQLDSPQLKSRLAAHFVALLKDTYVTVAETGADVGDGIQIVVASRSLQDGLADSLPRELHIRMVVRDFGAVQHTSDSFLFLNRLGVRVPPPPSGGTSVADTSAAPYRFLPTPGVTFGWTLNWRRQWATTAVSDIIRWLHPGVGINVSFPRFGTKITAFTPGNGTTPAQATVTDVDGSRFDLALGAVATFFDGAVQVTYGRTLTASDSPRYWGIGFSFIRVIGAVKSATSGAP
jgi:hypothetical protein